MFSKIATWGIGMLLLIVSCQKEGCHRSQENEILAEHPYNTRAYQNELYQLIKESQQVDYYFETREEIMGQTFLVVQAYGDAFCGKLCLVISEEDAKSIKLDKNKGYQGAQLVGLRYKEHTTYYGKTLVYDTLEYVVE